MNVQSILAVTDLSLPGCAALQRACELAERHGAELKLLHHTSGGATPGAAARLANAVHQLREASGITVRAVVAASHDLADVAREARCADLVVAPYRPRRTLATLLLGDPLLRILRAIACPLLVVKRVPLGPYRRVLVAVDLGRRSERLLRAASAVTPEAALEVFHAISTHAEGKMRLAQASEAALRHYRESSLRHAETRLAELVAAARLPSWQVEVAIAFGDPSSRAVVQQCSSRADLLAVGHGGRSLCGDLLFGSIAQRVTNWGHGDVLVVPQQYVPSTRRLAQARLRAEQRRLQHAPSLPERLRADAVPTPDPGAA